MTSERAWVRVALAAVGGIAAPLRAATVQALREAEVPVVACVRDDAICFDLRTLRPADFEALVASVGSTVWDDDPGPNGDGLPLPIL